jgi:hypothetical protein
MKVYDLIKQLVRYSPNTEVCVTMKNFPIKNSDIVEISYENFTSCYGKVCIIIGKV